MTLPPSSSTIPFRDTWLRRPTGGLWSNVNFLNLWSAESIAQVGAQISPVAIPLMAALTLNASAFQMGLLTAASGVPVLLLGILAGAWVDRLHKTPVMMAMDLGRALVLLAIPVAAVFDVLSIPLLIAVALLTGAQSVVFNAAYVSILPSLVKRSELSDANGKLYASMSTAQVVGPATAGTLISLLSAPVVMVINSLTYFGSAFFIRRIDHDEQPSSSTPDDRHLLREVSEGFRALFSSPVLRAISLSSATINLAGWMFLAVYVLYMTDDLGLSATGVGLVFASGGVGALLGSLVASRLSNRFGVGRTMVWAAILFGVFGLTVPMAILVPDLALPLIVFAEFAQWMTLVIFNVLGLSLRQTLTPARLLGRVAASNQVLAQGMMPIGSFLGGVIGSLASVQAALLTGVFGMFLAAGWVMFSPVTGIREMPAEPVDGDHAT
jgi:predicted MFS family arabinose efflux permease